MHENRIKNPCCPCLVNSKFPSSAGPKPQPYGLRRVSIVLVTRQLLPAAASRKFSAGILEIVNDVGDVCLFNQKGDCRNIVSIQLERVADQRLHLAANVLNLGMSWFAFLQSIF